MSKKRTSNKDSKTTGSSSKKNQSPAPELTEQLQNIRGQLERTESYQSLLKFVIEKLPSPIITKSMHCFDTEVVALKNALKYSHSIFAELPLITAYLVWSKYCYYKTEDLDYPKIAIEKEIIPFKNSSGRFLLIKDVSKDFFLNILEVIRCRRDLTLPLKEAFVCIVLDFNDWFCAETSFGNAYKIEDPDRTKTKGRIVEFDDFIEFLCGLDKRCQLVAKLLYFGGSRTLDEIINLQLESINFAEKIIAFNGIKITYPKHVFEDILSLVDGRASGNLFEGRKNTPLNAATIFRNFKEAAARGSLDDSFSPKSLTTNF